MPRPNKRETRLALTALREAERRLEQLTGEALHVTQRARLTIRAAIAELDGTAATVRARSAKAIAKKIRAAALRQQKDMAHIGLGEVGETDGQALRSIAEDVETGQLGHAAGAARRLDTAVRDCLPDTFWDLVDPAVTR